MNNLHIYLASFHQELLVLAFVIFLYTGILIFKNEKDYIGAGVIISAFIGLMSYVGIWLGLPLLATSGLTDAELSKAIELDQFFHHLELFGLGISLFSIAVLFLIRFRRLGRLNK